MNIVRACALLVSPKVHGQATSRANFQPSMAKSQFGIVMHMDRQLVIMTRNVFNGARVLIWLLCHAIWQQPAKGAEGSALLQHADLDALVMGRFLWLGGHVEPGF